MGGYSAVPHSTAHEITPVLKFTPPCHYSEHRAFNLIEFKYVANPSKHTVKGRRMRALPSQLLRNGAHLLKRRPFAITHFPNGSYRNLSLNEFEQILATFGDLLHGQRPQHGSRCMSKMGGFTQRTSCRSESGAA